MRLRLTTCLLAVITALASMLAATYAMFSDYESSSFTITAASVDMLLSVSDESVAMPALRVTVTNTGTIGSDLWLENISRQRNALAESGLESQLGIDLKHFFDDVTLEISYKGFTDTIHITDLDAFFAPVLLASGIAPQESAEVLIRQNAGSVITLNAPPAENTPQPSGTEETPEEIPPAGTDEKTDETEAPEEARDVPAEADTFGQDAEPAEDMDISQPGPSQTPAETEQPAPSENAAEDAPAEEAPTEDTTPAEAPSEDADEAEQPSEPEDVPSLSSEAAQAPAGYYETCSVYVPYSFGFILKSGSFTSPVKTAPFSLIKIWNIFVSLSRTEPLSPETEDTSETPEETSETTAPEQRQEAISPPEEDTSETGTDAPEQAPTAGEPEQASLTEDTIINPESVDETQANDSAPEEQNGIIKEEATEEICEQETY